MRNIITEGSLKGAIIATVILAATANLYELLCTAGFPLVFTRVLTLNELPAISYYLYLLLYNIVYIIPLAAIVLFFTITLGTRKLSENEGRFLKLLSGMMMLFLGIILLIAPELLSNIAISITAMVSAIVASFIISAIIKKED